MDTTKINLSLSGLILESDYRTGRSDSAADFYRPCLLRSCAYDRAVGYFRSSIYLIVGAATIDFARNGGKIRLLCSPALNEEDAKSIEVGYADREQNLINTISHEIDDMVASKGTEYRTRVLATLVSIGAMDIRLALRTEDQGLYHEKIGIFRDSIGNSVSFIGSANETWNAWHENGNFESIEIFCSWKELGEAERVKRHCADFEHLWNGEMSGLHVVPFPEAARKKLLKYAHPTLADIDVGLFEAQMKIRSPLPHQISAIENWELQGRRGVFEHATGSGKTFTALTAIKKHLEFGFPAMILVPSRLLLKQWAEEIRYELPQAALLLVGAGNNSWKEGRRLGAITSNEMKLGQRIVLATMQTAATDSFRTKITQGTHLMIVADEVHQIGSEFNSKVLMISTGPRLGLSATPGRFGDPIGTSRIFEYFGDVVLPKVTLQDAIRAGRLVEYEYHPHPVHLTAQEAQEWKELSLRIQIEVAQCKEEIGGNKIISDRAKMMLIQRSRIAKKAANKVPLAVDILKKWYKSGHRWLVYCEDSNQLGQIMAALSDAGLRPIEYHSSMEGNREAALDWFKTIGGVLVSIKCLDEGVDIPSIDHALILASSQNPRQFIQRRGRVLRQSKEKGIAKIHDAIVVPLSLDNEPEQFGLLKSEFLRAIEFADSALNRFAGVELRGIAERLGFNHDGPVQEGIEEEE